MKYSLYCYKKADFFHLGKQSFFAIWLSLLSIVDLSLRGITSEYLILKYWNFMNPTSLIDHFSFFFELRVQWQENIYKIFCHTLVFVTFWGDNCPNLAFMSVWHLEGASSSILIASIRRHNPTFFSHRWFLGQL